MLQKVIALGSFLVRHLVASVVSILAPAILSVIVYFALLAVAIVTGAGMGSPLALPFWFFFILLFSTAYTIFLLFPSVILAEVVSRVFGKWQHVAQVPISTLILAVIVVIMNFAVRLIPHYADTATLQWADYPLHIFLLLTIPLGLYWWTMKIVQAGIAVPAELLKRMRTRKDNASVQPRSSHPV